jgi:hypothetical protein
MTGWPGLDPRQRQRKFPLVSMSIPALRLTQPPFQWVQGTFPGEKLGRSVTLTTHPMSYRGKEWVRAIPPLALGIRCLHRHMLTVCVRGRLSWRILLNEEVLNLYSCRNITKEIKRSTMNGQIYSTHGEMRNACTILIRTPKERTIFGWLG